VALDREVGLIVDGLTPELNFNSGNTIYALNQPIDNVFVFQ